MDFFYYFNLLIEVKLLVFVDLILNLIDVLKITINLFFNLIENIIINLT